MQLSTSGSICELPSLCSVISLAHAAAGLYHSCGGDWETHHHPFLVQNRLRAGEQQKYTVRAAALHSSSPPTSLVSKLSFTVSGKSRYQAVSNCSSLQEGSAIPAHVLVALLQDVTAPVVHA